MEAKTVEERISILEGEIANLQECLFEEAASLRDRIYREFGEAAVKAAVLQIVSEIDPAKIAQALSSDKLAEALSKKVLITRSAQRHELKDAVAVRPATQAEIKHGKVASE
jgi:hypothetical protein